MKRITALAEDTLVFMSIKRALYSCFFLVFKRKKTYDKFIDITIVRIFLEIYLTNDCIINVNQFDSSFSNQRDLLR